VGPYCEVAEVAAELNIVVATNNEARLQACINVASTEIDHHLDDANFTAGELDPGLLNRTNINRAIEWWKAPAAYNGGVGIPETGQLKTPQSGFERHAAALLPLKVSWGLA